MPYIGNEVGNRFVASKAASVYSGDGSTTAFTLEHAVGSDEDILVSVDGVIQEPSVAYAVSSGTTLTFTAAPSSNSGNNIFVYYLFRTVATVDHPSTSALSATSGTFSTDLTVDTDTLKVDSTNNRVGINTTTGPESLNIGGGGNLRFQTTDTVRIEYLNSTGAYALGTTGGAAIGFNRPATGDYEIFFETHNGGVSHAERMRIDKDGHITMPHQTAFFATAGTQNNIAVGSDQLIVFGNEVFDQNSDFDTSNSTFTAPVTGQYHLTVQGYLKSLDTAASYIQVAIRVTNQSLYWLVSGDAIAADPAYFPITISTLVHMDANDTANVKYNQGTGAAQADVDNGLYFAGYLVC